VIDVSLVRCEDYGRERAYGAVKEAVDLIGGIEKFVRPGSKVLVKPNILQASSPDKAVCTHPDIMFAVCRLLREHGCHVILADSPGAGSIYGPSQMEKAYEEAGYGIVKELGVSLNTDVSYKTVPNPKGKIIKMFPLLSPAVEVDAIVIVSKLKTHSFTYLTAGTKNAFGLIPGMEKATFHGRLPKVEDFANMLVDLNELVGPKLEIIDAVMAMEGDGPYSGTPRKVGAVLASGSYAAIDVVASRLIGVDPLNVPTVGAAHDRGVLPKDLNEIIVKGEKLEDLVVDDFKAPSSYAGGTRKGPNGVMEKAAGLLKVYALRPVIVRKKCTACGRCVRSCPMHVIKIGHGSAKIRYRRCIRCYTCHEMCTSGAIDLRRSLAGKVVAKAVERRNRAGGAR